MILTTHCVQSTQVFRVQNHTLCAIVLAYIVITNSNCSHVCFQEFVLHTNCPDLDFELGGLINCYIMSMRDVSGLKCDTREHEAPKGGAI